MPNVSISPARKKNPPIVKSVEFAGFIRTNLSTVMCAMSVWIKDLKETMYVALTPGMKSAAYVLTTFFPVALFFPAHTRFIYHVRMPWLKMDPEVVLCVAIRFTHLLLSDKDGCKAGVKS